MPLLNVESQLLKIEGAQHGFAVDDDPTYLDPQSRVRQARIVSGGREVGDGLGVLNRFVLVSNLTSALCVPASVTQIWKRRRP
jgi:hypothetical protein